MFTKRLCRSSNNTYFCNFFCCAGLGWAMIPAVGWRIFLVAAALPAFAAAAGCLLLLPESPRYLLVHGRVGPAEKVGKLQCYNVMMLSVDCSRGLLRAGGCCNAARSFAAMVAAQTASAVQDLCV
jgi:hypothetical protein